MSTNNTIPKHFQRLLAIVLAFSMLTLVGQYYQYFNWLSGRSLAILNTTVITIATLFLTKFVSYLIKLLNRDRYRWQKRLHSALGLQYKQTIIELVAIRLVVNMAIWGWVIHYLLKFWDLPQTTHAAITKAILQGFTFSGMTFYPLRIIMALLLLPTLTLMTRLIKTELKNNQQIKISRGAKEALSTLFGYIGFTLSIIISLFLANVHFTGLAIIAGALSVGIGFGLQNIVNNFISGIILLIERPINVGDSIVVGSTRGTVKRITIRSTVIRTFDQAHVIVPNSDLITKEITNLVLDNKFTRLIIHVGVAYGSDLDLVTKLLLDIGSSHPEVITDDNIAIPPRAFFTEFADSHLNFQLSVIINDIRAKNRVTSELNHAIDKAFRQNNIEIAFPQLDVHVR